MTSEQSADFDLRHKAFEYLARREHSVVELRQKLSRFGDAEEINSVVEQLTEQGHQSDERFAEQVLRARFNQGKGPVRIKHELRQHQVDAELIDQLLSEKEDQWRLLAAQVRHKKFGSRQPDDYKEWARQARFLQQRGFSPDDFE